MLITTSASQHRGGECGRIEQFELLTCHRRLRHDVRKLEQLVLRCVLRSVGHRDPHHHQPDAVTEDREAGGDAHRLGVIAPAEQQYRARVVGHGNAHSATTLVARATSALWSVWLPSSTGHRASPMNRAQECSQATALRRALHRRPHARIGEQLHAIIGEEASQRRAAAPRSAHQWHQHACAAIGRHDEQQVEVHFPDRRTWKRLPASSSSATALKTARGPSQRDSHGSGGVAACSDRSGQVCAATG